MVKVEPMIDNLNTFELTGGALCLDFVNTADGDINSDWIENLRHYGDLIAFGQQTGLLKPAAAEHLLAEAAHRREDAEAVYNRALAVRLLIYRIFSALASGETPSSVDFAAFNALLNQLRLHVMPSASGFTWAWGGTGDALEAPLWPVMASAAELLRSDQLTRLHECAGDGCTWLFLDTSKNHSRRWCDMKSCGNRAKVRSHYQRTKHEG